MAVAMHVGQDEADLPTSFARWVELARALSGRQLILKQAIVWRKARWSDTMTAGLGTAVTPRESSVDGMDSLISVMLSSFGLAHLEPALRPQTPRPQAIGRRSIEGVNETEGMKPIVGRVHQDSVVDVDGIVHQLLSKYSHELNM